MIHSKTSTLMTPTLSMRLEAINQILRCSEFETKPSMGFGMLAYEFVSEEGMCSMIVSEKGLTVIGWGQRSRGHLYSGDDLNEAMKVVASTINVHFNLQSEETVYVYG